VTHGSQDDSLQQGKCDHATSLCVLDRCIDDKNVLDRGVIQTHHGNIDEVLFLLLRASTADCKSQGKVFDCFFDNRGSDVQKEIMARKYRGVQAICLRASMTSVVKFSKVVRWSPCM
jgi:hypothetical protein